MTGLPRPYSVMGLGWDGPGEVVKTGTILELSEDGQIGDTRFYLRVRGGWPWPLCWRMRTTRLGCMFEWRWARGQDFLVQMTEYPAEECIVAWSSEWDGGRMQLWYRPS